MSPAVLPVQPQPLWLPDVAVRAVPPQLHQAIRGLRGHLFDIRYQGGLAAARGELMAALPVVEPYEAQFAAFIDGLLRDLARGQRPGETASYLLRLSNAHTLLGSLLPQDGSVDLSVFPVHEARSYHFEARADLTADWERTIPCLQDTHIAFLAARCDAPTQATPDEEMARLWRPLSLAETQDLRVIAHMIAQACVDAQNLGYVTQAGLASAMSAIKGLATQLVRQADTYRTILTAPPIAATARAGNDNQSVAREQVAAIRQTAHKLENSLLTQMGNAALSAPLHQSLRTGLQRLRAATNRTVAATAPRLATPGLVALDAGKQALQPRAAQMRAPVVPQATQTVLPPTPITTPQAAHKSTLSAPLPQQPVMAAPLPVAAERASLVSGATVALRAAKPVAAERVEATASETAPKDQSRAQRVGQSAKPEADEPFLNAAQSGTTSYTSSESPFVPLWPEALDKSPQRSVLTNIETVASRGSARQKPQQVFKTANHGVCQKTGGAVCNCANTAKQADLQASVAGGIRRGRGRHGPRPA